MTGVLQVVTGSGSKVGVVPFAVVLSDTRSTGTASGSMTFASSGAITAAGSDTTNSGSWYRPNVAGIGSSYWIKGVVTGAAAATGPASGAVTSLSAGVGWSWTRATPGLTTSSIVVSIYRDAGGTQLETSATVSVSVERTGV